MTPVKKKEPVRPKENELMLAMLSQLDSLDDIIKTLSGTIKSMEQRISRLADRIGLPL